MQKSIVRKKHGLVLFNPQIGTLIGATTPGQSGPGSHGNEGVLFILQSSSIAGKSTSVCLISYPGHSLFSQLLGDFSQNGKLLLFDRE